MTRSQRWTRGRSDDGNVTMFLLFMVTMLMGFAGLVIDGGYTLGARQEASTIAEQAARQGADASSVGSLRHSGDARLDAVASKRAALHYLTATGHTGTITVGRDSVTVTVTVTKQTAILGVIGIDDVTVTSAATAHLVRGIASEES